MRIALSIAALVLLAGAAPPGSTDRMHTRKLVKNVRVARGTYYRTPWLYVWGARQVVLQLDCGGTAWPRDSAFTVHLSDDTSTTVRDSIVASGSANAASSQVANVSLYGVVSNKTLTRGAGKNYVLSPMLATAAGESGLPYIGVRWARVSVQFGSTDVTHYNGCDSLTVRSTTLRDWIFGTADY